MVVVRETIPLEMIAIAATVVTDAGAALAPLDIEEVAVTTKLTHTHQAATIESVSAKVRTTAARGATTGTLAEGIEEQIVQVVNAEVNEEANEEAIEAGAAIPTLGETALVVETVTGMTTEVVVGTEVIEWIEEEIDSMETAVVVEAVKVVSEADEETVDVSKRKNLLHSTSLARPRQISPVS